MPEPLTGFDGWQPGHFANGAMNDRRNVVRRNACPAGGAIGHDVRLGIEVYFRLRSRHAIGGGLFSMISPCSFMSTRASGYTQ